MKTNLGSESDRFRQREFLRTHWNQNHMYIWFLELNTKLSVEIVTYLD